MRDEKEERKKQARSNKQTRQSNTAHQRQSLFLEKISCLRWDSHVRTSTFKKDRNVYRVQDLRDIQLNNFHSFSFHEQGGGSIHTGAGSVHDGAVCILGGQQPHTARPALHHRPWHLQDPCLLRHPCGAQRHTHGQNQQPTGHLLF